MFGDISGMMGKLKEAQQKDRAMLHQSRLARLGTMISMIAHQWRQPLTEVSAILAELETATEFDKVNKQIIFDSVKESDKLIVYMSNTIDDFKNFFLKEKEKINFEILEQINSTVNIISSSLKLHDIKLDIIIQRNTQMLGYKNEYSQVLINIINNARDVLVQRKIQNPKITITISENKSNIITKLKIMQVE